MSEKPISPRRQRMLEDMSLRGFTPDTQRDYIRAVKKLAAFLGRSPDTATAEDLRAFQLHLTATGVQPPTINGTVTVLRFFFKVTLDRPETTRHLVFVYEPRKLPRVLSPEEVHAEVDFWSSVAGPVRKVLLTAAQSHNADLLVMGAFGHSRTRQILFGGVTQSVLEAAEIAVLLMH